MLDSSGARQADLLSDTLRGWVARLDQAHESREAESAEGEVAHSASCLSGVSPVPAVASKVVPELRNPFARHLHQFKPAVADQTVVGLQADGEESVAVLALVVEVALQPPMHLLPIERRLPERGHYRRVAKDPQQVVQVSRDHRAQQEPFSLQR